MRLWNSNPTHFSPPNNSFNLSRLQPRSNRNPHFQVLRGLAGRCFTNPPKRPPPSQVKDAQIRLVPTKNFISAPELAENRTRKLFLAGSARKESQIELHGRPQLTWPVWASDKTDLEVFPRRRGVPKHLFLYDVRFCLSLYNLHLSNSPVAIFPLLVGFFKHPSFKAQSAPGPKI